MSHLWIHPVYEAEGQPFGLAMWLGDRTYRVLWPGEMLGLSAARPGAMVVPIGDLDVRWEWPEPPEVSR